jgi:amino acid permease
LLGPFGTGFTLFKGFVASGILYLPTNFVVGGSVFSAVALVSALLLTLYCISLLLEVRKKIGGSLSFVEIGYHCYGTKGKVAVEISLFAS